MSRIIGFEILIPLLVRTRALSICVSSPSISFVFWLRVMPIRPSTSSTNSSIFGLSTKFLTNTFSLFLFPTLISITHRRYSFSASSREMEYFFSSIRINAATTFFWFLSTCSTVKSVLYFLFPILCLRIRSDTSMTNSA